MSPWTVAHPASLSLGFPRQEQWSGLLLPSPWDLPDPGINPASPALVGGFFNTELLALHGLENGNRKILQNIDLGKNFGEV